MRTARVVTTGVLLLTATAWAATTPAQKCRSAKNKEAGKYAACRQNAEAKFATTGDAAALAAALQKCVLKYAAKWPGLEAKARGTCPSNGDQAAIQGFIDAHTSNVAAALAGGTLPDATPRGAPLKTEQTTCWSGFEPAPCAGTGQDGDTQTGLARAYLDNGDGTITDLSTGLMWEKLSDDGSIHDKDNLFRPRSAPDVPDPPVPIPGFARNYGAKLAALNGGGGFAGYTDWRVPNVNELHSIVSYSGGSPAVSSVFHSPCSAGCSALTCSCTAPIDHFTSSAHDGDEWRVNFGRGDVKPQQFALFDPPEAGIRAVRAGVSETTVPTSTTTTTTSTVPADGLCCQASEGGVSACVMADTCTGIGSVVPGVCRGDGTCGAPAAPGDCCELPSGGLYRCLVLSSGTAAHCDLVDGAFASSAVCTISGCE